jgi:hypothetical protein
MDRSQDTSSRALATRLADRLDQRIPDGAVSLLVDGAAIIAWKGEASVYSPAVDGVLALHRCPGREAILSPLGSIAFEPAAIRKAAQDAPGMPLPVLLRYPARPKAKGGGPLRRLVFRRMLEGSDLPTLMLMDEIGFVVHARQEWLDSTSPGGERVHDFARKHPWLIPTAATATPDPIREAPASHDADAIASAMIRGILAQDHPRIPFVLDRLRGFVLSEDAADAVTREHLKALLALPEDMVPSTPLVGTDRRGPAQQAMLSCFCLAPDMLLLSRLSGRPVRSLMAKGGDWGVTAEAIGTRFGGEFNVDDYPDDWGSLHPQDALKGIQEMAISFAEGVLAPALLAVGVRWAHPPTDRAYHEVSHLRACAADPVLCGALRLLLGQRTLPALAEICADWHRHTSAISALVNSLRTGGGLSGPVAFDDLHLGDGFYITNLATPGALQDEGAPGPDAAGVPGLDHCVGSYSDRVLSGETSIISFRRRAPGGYVRISTAEVRFAKGTRFMPAQMIQHRGYRNADPTQAENQIVVMALRHVEGEAHERLSRFVPDPRIGAKTAAVIHEAGAWSAMRDAWAFALPRPLRTLDPQGLLEAAGMGAAGSGLLPVPD